MTKFPIIESWCPICRRVVHGDLEECPVCLASLIREAT